MLSKEWTGLFVAAVQRMYRTPRVAALINIQHQSFERLFWPKRVRGLQSHHFYVRPAVKLVTTRRFRQRWLLVERRRLQLTESRDENWRGSNDARSRSENPSKPRTGIAEL